MIPCNCIQEHLHQIVALGLGHIIDLLDMQSNSVDRVQARDRIGAHNGVFRREILSRVQGMPSGLCPQFKATGFLGADKVVLLVGGDREGLEVFPRHLPRGYLHPREDGCAFAGRSNLKGLVQTSN